MIIKPRAEYVLCRFHVPDGGEIILPDNYTGQLRRVEAVAVGPDVPGIEVGEFVLVTPQAAPVAADPNDSDVFLLHHEQIAATCIYEPSDDQRSRLIVTATGGVQ